MAGIFRKKIAKALNFESVPFSSEVLKTVERKKQGVVTSEVVVEKSDLSEYSEAMPTLEEFDVEQQIKAGVKLEQINVHGILPSPDGSFDVAAAFNRLQEQLDSLKPSEKEVQDVKEVINQEK